MTDQSSSAVGRAAIDAYLDSVELALIAADAPRIDRLQVLQDLEAQIADMLAQQPTPLTEEIVRAVLDKLEPPSHFAATYGNGREASPPSPRRFAQLTRARWPMIAAFSSALLPFACLLFVLAEGLHFRGPAIGLTFISSLFLGFVFSPIALWMAYKQLRTQQETPGRDLVLKSTIVYGVLAPALVMWMAAAMTDGYVLVPIGIAAFFYFQYILLRRLWRHMSDSLPPQSTTPKVNSNGHGASSPISPAAPMPAM